MAGHSKQHGFTKPIRLAIVVTHPIQYFAPLYRALARSDEVELCVFYCSRVGVDRFFDSGMGVELAWNMTLLAGYQSVFLSGAERIKSLTWRELDNPGVGTALARFRPDVVLINGYARKTLLRALIWCKRRGVPAMMISDSTTDTSRQLLRRAVKRLTFSRLLRRFGALLTMSERSEAYFVRYGVSPAQLFRVQVMIDTTFWKAREGSLAERQRMRGALGIGEAEIVLLYVGKLYSTKRVGDVIEAARRLNLPRLRLLVVGDGADRESLEAASRVTRVKSIFTGFVNIDQLAPYYSAADILVHPAELEQFGMITVEAAILGLPMILSDRVGAIGATSVARPGENTIVYPCGDVDALADAIRRLIDQPETRARMREASLRISLDHDGSKSVAGVLAAARHCLANNL